MCVSHKLSISPKYKKFSHKILQEGASEGAGREGRGEGH